MTEQYFEMLWDCPQCDAKDLLSKTHRHCPSCGAAQDPERRHFPRPDQEVEALGHRFVGVDWHCGYCEAPNSAAAAFCINCGGPQDGAAKVKLVQEPAATAPSVAPPPKVPPPPKSGLPWFKLILIFLLLAGVGLGYLFFSKHDEQVTVVDKTWNRQVDVERFMAVRDSAWCDAMPADAYQITRSREQRSTRQIPDGQDCVDVRADAGDGTFSKRQECTPRYREEPQYDMKCSFRVNRWRLARTDRLVGDARLAPAWPTPMLANNLLGSNSLGGERLGARREVYSVRLQSSQGRSWDCPLNAQSWPQLEQGQTLALRVRGTGGADCDSLLMRQ
ncbi:MAG: zinc ribbon domain-containing protein [Rhodoferax sp.]|jgi:hypothetical protein|uniref:zinc ribbon domain-containing protein n=1 Tax=Rhodoferax sp. TaxID=50421 RepID=UPI001B6121B6|nr:zinc ribbon domain-containing protein [Rhodoferax sp.]MBP9149812.1 zinc ribbon domain-containing protein [Rhodoferax sp.]MBP9735230.1 zinc ribbon domain-containing protein [Rhodoferax sp.]